MRGIIPGTPDMKHERLCMLRQKNHRKGIVTIPFLIAFVIVIFLILSFFRLTLTLTYASVVQYISYSSARRLSIGDVDKNTQRSKGEEKYSQLSSELLKQSNWFDVPASPQTGFNADYVESGLEYRNLFYGTFVPFTSKLISFRIPLLAGRWRTGFNHHYWILFGKGTFKRGL